MAEKIQPKYQVYFWRDKKGNKPVADWMRLLPLNDRKYLGGLLRDLAYDGPGSRPKCFKHLEGALWELRDLRKGRGFRVYFGFDGYTICIVIHAGDKSTQSRDIKFANIRLKELETNDEI